MIYNGYRCLKINKRNNSIDLWEDDCNWKNVPGVIDLLDKGVVLLPESHDAPRVCSGRELQSYSVVDMQSYIPALLLTGHRACQMYLYIYYQGRLAAFNMDI